MSSAGCPLCNIRSDLVFFRADRVLALWDPRPVSPGHTLVVPRRHITTWFDAAPEEQAELCRCLSVAKAVIEARHAPDGYTIGIDIGEAAGQALPHLHIHLIPRYTGDVPDARRGVRWIVPDVAASWERSQPPDES